MRTLANTNLLEENPDKLQNMNSVVSENISVCSTQLKRLGKIVYRSKIDSIDDEKELQEKLQFANKLSWSQRKLISKLLNLQCSEDSMSQYRGKTLMKNETKSENGSNTNTKTFINDLGFEEELLLDSETLVDEDLSEDLEEDEDDILFINEESEESEEETAEETGEETGEESEEEGGADLKSKK